jgi:YfiH family protein
VTDSIAAAAPPDAPVPADSFEWRATAFGPALVCTALEPFATHVFTTRAWQLGGAAVENRETGWAEVAAALHVDAHHLVRAHQVHGAAVVVHRRGNAAAAAMPLPNADILITDDPSTALAIQTADCVPLLLADRRSGAVGAAHAGWRGLAARVPATAVRAMRDAFSSAPEDLMVAIGPSICAANYEVDDVVRSNFEGSGASGEEMARWFEQGRPDHWQFDGWQAAIDQLEAAGVDRTRIHVARLCTAESASLCSYRRDGLRAGRMAAAIRIRSGDDQR